MEKIHTFQLQTAYPSSSSNQYPPKKHEALPLLSKFKKNMNAITYVYVHVCERGGGVL